MNRRAFLLAGVAAAVSPAVPAPTPPFCSFTTDDPSLVLTDFQQTVARLGSRSLGKTTVADLYYGAGATMPRRYSGFASLPA